MKGFSWLLVAIWVVVLGLCPEEAAAQTREDKIVTDSILVFDEIMAIQEQGIPKELLQGAHAVAIIPNVLKGSFVLGARFGRGTLLIRDERGAWHAPVFVTLAGGNVGWQVGVQSTDVILVFKTRKSVEGLLNGKVTLGADAAVAAGPIGRQAAAATDTRLAAEIFSYSRSRGLFAGVSFDGSSIKVDPDANGAYYRPMMLGGPVTVPEAAQQLAAQVLDKTGLLNEAAATSDEAASISHEQWQQAGQAEDAVSVARNELAGYAPQLYALLDPTWQEYLGLPVEVFHGGESPTVDSLNAVMARFESVRQDPQYRVLSERPEFLKTGDLLKRYVDEVSAASARLQLPAPPGAGQ